MQLDCAVASDLGAKPDRNKPDSALNAIRGCGETAISNQIETSRISRFPSMAPDRKRTAIQFPIMISRHRDREKPLASGREENATQHTESHSP